TSKSIARAYCIFANCLNRRYDGLGLPLLFRSPAEGQKLQPSGLPFGGSRQSNQSSRPIPHSCRFRSVSRNDFWSSFACPLLPLFRLPWPRFDPQPTSVSQIGLFRAPFRSIALRNSEIRDRYFESFGAYGCSAAALKCLVILLVRRNFLMNALGASFSFFTLLLSPARITWPCRSALRMASSEDLTSL